MLRILVVFISIFITLPATAHITHYRIDFDQSIWHLHPNMTFEVEDTTKTTLLSPYSVKMLGTDQKTFTPENERLELIEAYVIVPDGKRVDVDRSQVFTRPSPIATDASSFADSKITTVVFPQLQLGCQIVERWKLTRFKPNSLNDINILYTPNLSAEITHQEILIHKPDQLSLKWDKHGAYKITTKHQENETLIKATLDNKKSETPEANIPDILDFEPVFSASSHSSLEDIGKQYFNLSQSQTTVTPEIQILAKKIVGDKTGIEAARALYNWTTQNLHYISVGLNEAARYTPHSATEILKNRYGDCKDYSLLLQTLLKSIGIKSYTALIDWGYLFKKLPVPSPYQFNHAILYIPEYHLFANPTDSSASFGALDAGLSNKVVVIASESGEVINTPINNPYKNRYVLKNKIHLLPNGDIHGKSTARFSGNLNNNIRNTIDSADSLKSIAESLLAETPEGGSGNITATNPHDLDHNMTIHGRWKSLLAFNMEDEVYFNTPYGIDFFLPSNLRQNITYGKRRYPAHTDSFTLHWNYEIYIPKNYTVETLPKDALFKNAAGSYHSHYSKNSKGIKVSRNFVLIKSYYEPEEYENLNQLKLFAARDAKSICVLKKAAELKS